jgi:hypothetical protein
MKKKYNNKIKKNGKTKIIKFLSSISEINLIVVSEKIITKKPITNVRYLIFV